MENNGKGNNSKERRYQWAITIILTICMAIIGFLAGMLLQTERMKNQVTTNTAIIGRVEKDIAAINIKLDRLFFTKDRRNIIE